MNILLIYVGGGGGGYRYHADKLCSKMNVVDELSYDDIEKIDVKVLNYCNSRETSREWYTRRTVCPTLEE